MSTITNDNEDYEDDYEDEFELENSGEGMTQLTADIDNNNDGHSAVEDTEVVSLEEYMKRLEDAVPGDGEDGVDGDDIMDSITRGLDGLSPSPSARRSSLGDKYGHSSPTEDSDDAILKKFDVKLSPRVQYKGADFLEQYLRGGDKPEPDHRVAKLKEKYGYSGNDIADITRLAEQGTHDRSIPEDAGLKLIELKRKVSRLEDRIKRDAEIKQHLKSICASLKDELFVANQKMEYMHAELQSKKKPKAKKKVVKSKATEENAELRQCVASLESNEAALLEKVEALSAINSELNLQLKQSISREMDWRNAHQELSDRVLKQFSSPERKKGTASVGSLHQHVPVADINGRVQDHGYGKPKRRPEFKHDCNMHRSESDPRGKRKSKKLPPL